jgi:Glycosyl transferase family 4 group
MLPTPRTAGLAASRRRRAEWSLSSPMKRTPRHLQPKPRPAHGCSRRGSARRGCFVARALPNVQNAASDFKFIRYKPHRSVGKHQHPCLRRMEDAVLYGQALARILLKLKAEGWRPDSVLVGRRRASAPRA